MDEKEQNTLLLEGFTLALRTMAQVHGIQVTGSGEQSEPADYRYWDLLEEVAEGRTTLISSPADRFAQLSLKNEFKQSLVKSTNQLMAKDREMARRVLEALKAIDG